MSQIVCMKAYEGFADRLQALSHLLQYCIVHDAILCVDWRDENWGQGTLDFSDLFDISGVKTISWHELPSEGKIVPSVWTHEDIRKPMDKRFLSKEYTGPLMEDSDQKIEGDIIVTNSKGFRRFHIINMVNNLRIKQSVMEKIRHGLQNFYLPCTVVHLRGTDRYADSTIEIQLDVYKKLLPHEKARMYIVSDSNKLVQEWLTHVPACHVINQCSKTLTLPDELKQGTHQLSSEVLEFYRIKKYDLIIESLIDFIALCFAPCVIGNEKSVFFHMPRFLNQLTPDHLSQMFYGYKPERRPLTFVASST